MARGYRFGVVGSLSIVPDGSTVLPTDDIQIWLKCASIKDKTYTTLAQVLADSTTLQALISSNNAVDYMVRSTTWASGVTADSDAMTLIGANNYASNTLLGNSTWLNAICNSTYFESVLNVKVPTMTSATTPSGEVGSSSEYTNYYAWNVFDNNNATFWTPSANQNPSSIWYKFDNSLKVCMSKFVFKLLQDKSSTINVKIIASNDGTNWDDITDGEDIEFTKNTKTQKAILNTASNYKYFGLYFSGNALYVSGSYQGAIYTVQFYGRQDV